MPPPIGRRQRSTATQTEETTTGREIGTQTENETGGDAQPPPPDEAPVRVRPRPPPRQMQAQAEVTGQEDQRLSGVQEDPANVRVRPRPAPQQLEARARVRTRANVQSEPVGEEMRNASTAPLEETLGQPQNERVTAEEQNAEVPAEQGTASTESTIPRESEAAAEPESQESRFVRETLGRPVTEAERAMGLRPSLGMRRALGQIPEPEAPEDVPESLLRQGQRQLDFPERDPTAQPAGGRRVRIGGESTQEPPAAPDEEERPVADESFANRLAAERARFNPESSVAQEMEARTSAAPAADDVGAGVAAERAEFSRGDRALVQRSFMREGNMNPTGEQFEARARQLGVRRLPAQTTGDDFTRAGAGTGREGTLRTSPQQLSTQERFDQAAQEMGGFRTSRDLRQGAKFINTDNAPTMSETQANFYRRTFGGNPDPVRSVAPVETRAVPNQSFAPRAFEPTTQHAVERAMTQPRAGTRGLRSDVPEPAGQEMVDRAATAAADQAPLQITAPPRAVPLVAEGSAREFALQGVTRNTFTEAVAASAGGGIEGAISTAPLLAGGTEALAGASTAATSLADIAEFA